MPKKYRSNPDVFLIPPHQYDPSIHEIEYRYLQPFEQRGQSELISNVQANADTRYLPVPFPGPYGRPRPPYHPVFPYGAGYHPGGYPYGGGYHPYHPYHPGYPYGGGYHHPGGYPGGYHGGHIGGYHPGGYGQGSPSR